MLRMQSAVNRFAESIETALSIQSHLSPMNRATAALLVVVVAAIAAHVAAGCCLSFWLHIFIFICVFVAGR